MQVKPALRAYGQQVPKTVKTHIHTYIQKSNKLQIINYLLYTTIQMIHSYHPRGVIMHALGQSHLISKPYNQQCMIDLGNYNE